MRVRIESSNSRLRAMLRRDAMKWLMAAVSISLVSVASGIWLVYCGDSISPVILVMVSFGTLRTNAFERKMDGAACAEEPMQRIPERALVTHLKSVLRLGLTMLDAKSVALTLWETSTGQRLDWNMQRTGEFSALVLTKPEPCLRPQRSDFCSAIYFRKPGGIACLGVDWDERPINEAKLLDDLRVLWRGSFQTLLLSYLQVGTRWQGTVAYMDAPIPCRPDDELCRLQQVIGIATSASNLLQMACDSARADERRRLARDLHDGVTQSLIATELQIALLERGNAKAGSCDHDVLENVRETLCRETRKLRVQIQGLQRGESSEPPRAIIEKLVKEFELETGVASSFYCEIENDQISLRLAYELTCLLEEALSNVRKYSGAKRVEIGLSLRDAVHLYIEDDGCGLDFSGRYDLAALQSMRHGPRTICERVGMNGGGLILESYPGTGVRLEISLPLSAAGDFQINEPEIPWNPTTNGPQRVPLQKPLQRVDAVPCTLRTS